MLSVEKIDKLLKEKGWNRADLARHSDMTESHISHMLRRQNDIRISTLEKLCSALDCRYEDICDEG